MSQQSKCDRCGVVADKAPSPGFGHNMGAAPGWAQLHIHQNGPAVTLDLCEKCFAASIEGAGLAIAIKKAEAAHETAYAMLGEETAFGAPIHHHHGPVRPFFRPPPKKH